MALYIASLNSGSNGNCYYIGNEHEAVLIDAGISCRETEKRMNRLGLEMGKVKAIFVSHEHSDHITGVPGISKKFQLPVYITASTLRDACIPLQDYLVNEFSAGSSVLIGRLQVTAFVKCHDAIDPHSFIISDGKTQVGVFTDIGNCCKEVITHFQSCHAVFLESNYCEDMLAKGNYPYYLKKRISGDTGHLSNRQALELFRKYRGKQLTHLILSHLSRNNNSPELVDHLFRQEAKGIEVVVASRYIETAVFRIEGNGVPAPAPYNIKTKPLKPVQQLSLF